MPRSCLVESASNRSQEQNLSENRLFLKLFRINTEIEIEEKTPKDTTAWKYDVKGRGQKCVERFF